MGNTASDSGIRQPSASNGTTSAESDPRPRSYYSANRAVAPSMATASVDSASPLMVACARSSPWSDSPPASRPTVHAIVDDQLLRAYYETFIQHGEPSKHITSLEDIAFFCDVQLFRRICEEENLAVQREQALDIHSKYLDEHAVARAAKTVSTTELLAELHPRTSQTDYRGVFDSFVSTIYSDLDLSFNIFLESADFREYRKKHGTVVGQPTLADVLESPDLRACFVEELTDQHSEEGVLFIEAVERYKAECLVSDRPLDDAARDIYTMFVNPGAEMEVSLDVAVRKTIQRCIHPDEEEEEEEKKGRRDEQFLSRVFDEACDTISKHLAIHALPSFLRSERYKLYQQRAMRVRAHHAT